MASRAVPPGASQRAGALGEQRKQRGDVQRAGGKSGHDGVTGAGSARIDAMEAEAGQARCGRVLARTPPEDMPCEALVGSMPGGPSARRGGKGELAPRATLVESGAQPWGRSRLPSRVMARGPHPGGLSCAADLDSAGRYSDASDSPHQSLPNDRKRTRRANQAGVWATSPKYRRV